MVVKKKGLYLGLLVSLLGTGNVMQAYNLTIENRTPFKVKQTIRYHGETFLFCRSDKGKIVSGSKAKIKSVLCTVKKVQVTLLDPAGAIKAKEYSAPLRRPGNTTFAVSKIKGKSGFEVTRIRLINQPTELYLKRLNRFLIFFEKKRVNF